MDGKQLVNEVNKLLNLRDLGRFENVLNDFANYLQTLRLQEILLENWGTIGRIEVGIFLESESEEGVTTSTARRCSRTTTARTSKCPNWIYFSF